MTSQPLVTGRRLPALGAASGNAPEASLLAGRQERSKTLRVYGFFWCGGAGSDVTPTPRSGNRQARQTQAVSVA